jgi:hypothetical protein
MLNTAPEPGDTAIRQAARKKAIQVSSAIVENSFLAPFALVCFLKRKATHPSPLVLILTNGHWLVLLGLSTSTRVSKFPKKN